MMSFAGRILTMLCAALCVLGTDARAQLVLTPGPTVSVLAGSGREGYSGDGGVAATALLRRPAGVAYDAAGNLYLADSGNHVVRRVAVDGTIATVAGDGQQGFAGDGGAATLAQLDTPSGVAVSAAGILYIADAGNRRVRAVSAAGVITTIAGGGTDGDGVAAASAQLRRPVSVAVDAAGDVFIADADDFRVRAVLAADGTIHTVAGDGVQGDVGDGGAATSAEIDRPSSVAAGADGTIYIADARSHRVRAVSAAGVITTLAGDGMAGDADGAATGASLRRPSGVAVDAHGNVTIADADSARVRQVSGGVIGSVAGDGTQSSTVVGGTALSAEMNKPTAVAVGASGVVVADRAASQAAAVVVPSVMVGAGVPAVVGLKNVGASPLVVSAMSVPAGYTLTDVSCGVLPIQLTGGASCNETLALTASTAGSYAGQVQFTVQNGLPAQMQVSGTVGGGAVGQD